MKSDEVLSALLPVLVTIIGALGSLALVYVKVLIAKGRKQIASLQNEEDRKFALDVLDGAESCIETAVITTNQELVDDLKAAAEDGKLTPEEMDKAFNKTYSHAKSLMGQELREEVKKLVPDFEDWLRSKIKVHVAYNK
jgi:ABC-type sulfate transport system substrate-binding protein